MGLRWSDIRGNVFHVQQTMVRAGKELVTSTPKTKSGERRATVVEYVLSIFEAQRRARTLSA